MTTREASQKVLVVLFGMKVPARRSCIRVEKPAPRPQEPARAPSQSLQRIREVCERNRAKAPRPVVHFSEPDQDEGEI